MIIPGVKSVEEAMAVADEIYWKLGIRGVRYKAKIVNIVVTLRLDHKLKPENIVGAVKLRGMTAYRVKINGKSALIYSSGNIVIKGLRDFNEVEDTVNKFLRLLHKTR